MAPVGFPPFGIVYNTRGMSSATASEPAFEISEAHRSITCVRHN